MPLFPKPFLFASLLLLCSCASMNQSECLNANWQMIGLEDGAQGRTLAYVGNHRKACAEYGISPDLEQYQAGHTRGLQQFCTYARGFALGQRGSRDPNVCPPQLSGDFRFGHQRGLEIYRLNRELQQTRSTLQQNIARQQDLLEEVEYMEGLIISRKTRESERALLLMEVKEAQTEIGRLEVEADLLRHQAGEIAQERDYLKRKYQSGN